MGYLSGGVGNFAFLLVCKMLGLCVICMIITKCIFSRRIEAARKIDLEEAEFLSQQTEMYEQSTPVLVFVSPNQMPMSFLPHPQQYIQVPYVINQE